MDIDLCQGRGMPVSQEATLEAVKPCGQLLFDNNVEAVSESQQAAESMKSNRIKPRIELSPYSEIL